jgi:hypothetical protein
VDGGKRRSPALCRLAAVLLARIAACLRSGRPYELRDVDRRAMSAAEVRATRAERYTVPSTVRAARRSLLRPQL